MQLPKALLALSLLASSAFSTPITEHDIEASLVDVACTPDQNKSKTNPFKIDLANAQAQARKGGFTEGKSGYPHRFENREDIVFGVRNCDSKQHPVLEYPIYWKGSKQTEWRKDEKKDLQQKTPVRVAYANVNGGNVYCGIMVHKVVAADYTGSGAFVKCPKK